MPLDLGVPGQLTVALIPDLVLMSGAMALLLVGVWRRESPAADRLIGALSLVLCAATAVAVIGMVRSGASASVGLVAVDRFRWIADQIILLATAMTIALTMDHNARQKTCLSEGYVLVLLSAAGMMLLAAARDLIVLFLGIELMSMTVYVLAGLDRRSPKAAEASLKYFLLGSFATAFLLYGIALVYGATGATGLPAIGERLRQGAATSPMLRIGIAMLIVGLGFKVGAVPFHMWTPDVYEGAPTPFTAFMAAGVKAAGFVAFLRVWMEAFPLARVSWSPVLWWLAAATMVVGNLVALQQKNLKRMLAYSSIAHGGYLLVAVVASSPNSLSAILFYMAAYTLATMGAFAVVLALSESGGRGEQVADLAGLWQARPWLAGAMAIFMLALLGFPIAGGMGFFAKWYVLVAALTAPSPQISLAVVLVLTSVLSAGYYLGVVLTMYMKPRPESARVLPPTAGLTRLVIGVAAVALLVFGVFPGTLVQLAQKDMRVAAPSIRAPVPMLAPPTPR